MPRRVTRSLKTKPLPQRQGIDPVCLLLPRAGESAEEAAAAQPPRPTETFGAETVLDYLVARFFPHERAPIAARFERGEVVDDDGRQVSAEAPLAGQQIWYYRQLGDERPVPFDMPVLFEDDWVLAIDKPHFLPTTPNGSFVLHTALAKLRVRENNPDLIPIHRLDRLTAGVVLFAKTPEARAPFQTMFQERFVAKIYEAVAAPIEGLDEGESLEFSSRITKQHGNLQVSQLTAEAAEAAGLATNSHTRITCLREFSLASGVLPETSSVNPELPLPHGRLAHLRLEPHTGKTHQLRAHLWALGSPIAGDVLYPRVLGYHPDEPLLPLQLLARSVSFEHPVTGEATTITSQRQLKLTQLSA